MARPLRLEFPGAVYHITARGNARQDVYLDDDDRREFLRLLARESEQQRWQCYAYCLMGNHYHLLIETPEPNLVRGMRRLQGVYTQAFNRRHGRVGHLFQGRYKSILVDRDAYGLELCRYIVLNPVRAGWVSEPGDWPWSSYLETAGETSSLSWLKRDWVLGQFAEDGTAAGNAYAHFVAQGIGGRSPWEDLRGQIWLGSEIFREKMERALRGRDLTGVPSRQRQPNRPTVGEVIESVCGVYAVSMESLLSRVNREAFECAVYLLRRAANRPLREVAELMGISAPRVSQIQNAVESAAAKERFGRLLNHYNLKH